MTGFSLIQAQGKFRPRRLWSWSLSLWRYLFWAFISMAGCSVTSSGNKAAAVRKKPFTHTHTHTVSVAWQRILKVILSVFCTAVYFEQPMTTKLARKKSSWRKWMGNIHCCFMNCHHITVSLGKGVSMFWKLSSQISAVLGNSQVRIMEDKKMTYLNAQIHKKYVN